MYSASKDRYTAMEYNRCGNSGLMLPKVSLGLWHNFGDTANFENMRQLCFTAFDRGITQFDLANNYGPQPGSAEKNFGRILKEDLGVYRDELVITTKAGYLMWEGPYGEWGSRKHMLSSLDQSLRRLGLEYVDIFYHHRMDANTPLEETMGALATAVHQGKALYAGLSNYNGETLGRAAAILKELNCPFVINQNRYSIFDRTIEQNGLKDTARKLQKGLITFSPLAQGQLTDRYLNGIPADSRIRTDGRYLKEATLAPPPDGADPPPERPGRPTWGESRPDGPGLAAAAGGSHQRPDRRLQAPADPGQCKSPLLRPLYGGRAPAHRRNFPGIRPTPPGRPNGFPGGIFHRFNVCPSFGSAHSSCAIAPESAHPPPAPLKEC